MANLPQIKIIEEPNGKFGVYIGGHRVKLLDSSSDASNFKKSLMKSTTALSKRKNPAELLKSGEWTPAHAIRIRKGRLEILNPGKPDGYVIYVDGYTEDVVSTRAKADKIANKWRRLGHSVRIKKEPHMSAKEYAEEYS